jgi:hypothetical protein
MRGGCHSGGGAGRRHRERFRASGLDRHHPARGVQQVQRDLRPERRHQLLDVARGERHHRRVQHGRRRALVLAELGVDGTRDRDVAERAGERLGQGPLVDRIGIRVQEADGHALDAFARERVENLRQRGRVERGEDRAVRPDSLGHLKPEPARHHGLGLRRRVQIVQVVPAHARDL